MEISAASGTFRREEEKRAHGLSLFLRRTVAPSRVRNAS
jgi:hypothetical protein